MTIPRLILASGSASRRKLLEGAGLEFDICVPNIDEDSARRSMRASGVKPGDQAMQLAELKALKISDMKEGLVIGGDQMLSLGDQTFDKPADMEAARRHLRQFSGRTHYLETALVLAEEGRIIWRHMARPALSMRVLSEEFTDAYLAQTGPQALETVGAYRLEGRGIQLFDRIEGDYFSILGLPLLALLDYLRTRGLIGS